MRLDAVGGCWKRHRQRRSRGAPKSTECPWVNRSQQISSNVNSISSRDATDIYSTDYKALQPETYSKLFFATNSCKHWTSSHNPRQRFKYIQMPQAFWDTRTLHLQTRGMHRQHNMIQQVEDLYICVSHCSHYKSVEKCCHCARAHLLQFLLVLRTTLRESLMQTHWPQNLQQNWQRQMRYCKKIT